jgi:hypothetical protein
MIKLRIVFCMANALLIRHTCALCPDLLYTLVFVIVVPFYFYFFHLSLIPQHGKTRVPLSAQNILLACQLSIFPWNHIQKMTIKSLVINLAIVYYAPKISSLSIRNLRHSLCSSFSLVFISPSVVSDACIIILLRGSLEYSESLSQY